MKKKTRATRKTSKNGTSTKASRAARANRAFIEAVSQLAIPPVRTKVRMTKVKVLPAHKPRPTDPVHPGEVLLLKYLLPKNITQAELTDKLKWKLTRLNKLVNGKGGVTASSAIDLARVTHTTPEYWLNLQMDYDLKRAKQSARQGR
jgi:addiction module HigA family antidote